jgi:hypothetical protein
MSISRIEVDYWTWIEVWASSLGVGVEITGQRGQRGSLVAFLTAEKTDELIRALAAARVEISKERPSR